MKKLFIIILVIIVISCRSKNIDPQINSIEINFDQICEISSEKVFKNIKLIPIEIRSDCLFKYISKIIQYNNNYYILDIGDIGGGQIGVIDKNGKIINYLQKQGKGPGEYLLLSDFDINPTNGDLYIVDNYNRKILIYNNNLEFIRSIKPDSKIPLNLISLNSNNNIIVQKDNSKSIPKLNYHIVEFDHTGDLINTYFHYNKITGISFGRLFRLWKINDFIDYLPNYSNTIYRIRNDSIFPVYEFVFDKKCLTYEEWELTHSYEDLVYNRYFFENTNHLIFNYGYNSVFHFTIYNKYSNKLISLRNTKDPSCNCGSLIKIVNFTNNKLVLEAHNLNIIHVLDIIDPERKETINLEVLNNISITGDLAEQILLVVDICI